MDAPFELLTLSGILEELRARGFAEDFQIVEGVSDPDDMAILCAIETRTGGRGTVADAFGVYADPTVGGFMRAVDRCGG